MITRCVVCQRNDTAEGRVCESCTTRVLNDLHEIDRRYGQLSARPGVGGDNAGRRSPGFDSSPCASLSVISMRDVRDHRSVPAVLGTWATKVAVERKVTQPHGVDECVAFLERHFAWLADRAYVATFVGAVRGLLARLRPVTGEPSGSIVIGRCPNTLDEGEHTAACGTKLTAPLYGDAVECPNPRCARVWPRREWTRLGQLLEAS